MAIASPQMESQIEPPRSRTGCVLLGVGGGCLGLILLCGGLAGFGIFSLMAIIKSSDPYTESLRQAQQNDELGDVIGQPIDAGFFVQGNINLNNDDGKADLSYTISGPDGSATVKVEGTKTDGDWTYSRMDATTDDGSVIDLQNVDTAVNDE